MNSILSIDYNKIKYQCVYFIKFTSNHFDKELFNIGVTMNLNDRLKNLAQEFKIDGNYKLLLAIHVRSDEIEKDLLNAFEKLHPTLKIDLNICNNKKTECFIYSDSLLESINTVKLEFCKQTSKKYIENVEVVARDRLEEVLCDTKRARFPTFRRAKQVLRDNQVTHSNLDQVQDEISAKLDKVTYMIIDLSTKTS